MSQPQKANRIMIVAKGEVELQPFELPELGSHDVLIETKLSKISTGTENICIHQMFEPNTHWSNWVKLPMQTGYIVYGVVTKVGNKVELLKVGDKVVSRVTHASHSAVHEEHAFKVPEGIDPKEAIWFALGIVAFQGAKAGPFGFGDDILVVGAGPIGQMTTRWAKAFGACRIVTMDTVPMRLNLAKEGGASAVISHSVDDAKIEVLDAFGGKLPSIVADSTGHAGVFSHCLGLVRDRGILVLIGDTGTPSEQRLTLDVVVRGVKIHGAHMMHFDEPWSEKRIVELYFEMILSKRMTTKELCTHTFSPNDCKEAYRFSHENRRDAVGVLFDWEK